MSSLKNSRKGNSSTSSAQDQLSESRRRQTKRDDAIRRRIENDLSKKKRGGTRTTRSKKATPGTVLSLRPSDPIICKTSATVYEVSQLMSAKRENCILVVNDGGELLGIFTAKDLAFRIVGAGLSANSVTIDQIMTPNPMCANASTPASEALTLMVERGFRHLPVLDDNNQIVGVLDITKCYAQQMEKLERMHASSKKLYEALDSVHSEMGALQQPLQIYQYFENLKDKMNGPTLDNVLDASTIPVYTNVKASVYDATVLMKENRTTAVLVKDNNDEVTGIFTSKDVVLRVIAAGLDPKKCSIVRVMTPQPDVAKISLPIQRALRQMFEGHYLNLPVVGEDNDIIGIVDVLKLTYATLNQIKQLETTESGQGSSTAVPNENDAEGPAWNKFWTSLDNDDSDSVHSDSVTESAPDITPSEFQSFNVDIKPSDSVSHVDSPSVQRTSLISAKDDDVAYTFKFKSVAIEGRVHRISLRASEGVARLRSLMDEKLHKKDFELLRVQPPNGDEDRETYAISYIDDEGDIVSITSDSDLVECIKINQLLKNDKADLYLHNPHEPAPIDSLKLHSEKQKRRQGSSDIIEGVPNGVLVSGALAVSALSVAVIFAFGRK
ncbi:CBS-domain-containing protein [Suhomyces tanzawaensis NRRL Y-17324]|uniref:CBS-domain-containing protein n=1 Tax=Suhomyces tanzawaensis NRRL Y-17324 TaxID=984487 RepID=A0A1E4SFS5_9ASCO|nr:CBS-domain-containing protein [Suhomyces tanzawaensis NRRL Y-17324]ODV78262.1 CBS-domain-containing protein [Suhomyces tanzawaensis NRRL Y-17324]